MDHLEAGRDVVLDHGLWRRDDANALTVTVSALGDFVARFEPPAASLAS